MTPAAGARRLRAALAAVAALVVVLLAAAPAAAHSELVHTSPGDGQVYGTSQPTTVALSFTEKVQAGLSRVRLIGPGGDDVDLGGLRHPEGDGTTVEADVPADLPDGAWTVAWNVVSADGHPVQGAFGFAVGDAAAPAAAASADHHGGGGSADPFVSVARWAGYVGYALLVGAAAFVVLCWPGGHRSAGVRALAWTGFGVSVGATLASLLLYGPYVTGGPISGALDGGLLADSVGSREGKGLLARAALLLLVAPLLAALLRHGRTRQGAAAVLLLSGALACTWSATGHGSTDLRTAPMDVAHLLAMGVWTGGLAVLVVALWRHQQDSGLREAVRAFSPVALGSVVVLVASGSYQAWRQVRSVPALTGTDYGRLVTIKVIAVIGLLLLAAAARSWVRRRPSGSALPDVTGLRRAVGAEALVAVAVLGLSAVLVGTEPARVAVAQDAPPPVAPTTPSATPAPSAPAPGGAAPAAPVAAAPPAPARAVLAYDTGGAHGKGLVVVEVQPPRVGQATVHLTAVDPAGRPLPVSEMTMALGLPAKQITGLPVSLIVAGTGHYSGTMTIPTPGDWEVAVTVRTSDVDQSTSRATLTVPA